jgi:hypothetical protein
LVSSCKYLSYTPYLWSEVMALCRPLLMVKLHTHGVPFYCK